MAQGQLGYKKPSGRGHRQPAAPTQSAAKPPDFFEGVKSSQDIESLSSRDSTSEVRVFKQGALLRCGANSQQLTAEETTLQTLLNYVA